jgi:hypothetical protein
MEEIGVEIPHAIQRVTALDRRVARLDPLGADYFFRWQFRVWNDLGYFWLIAAEATKIASRLYARERTLPELMAAKRDLAMIAAAILRHLPPRFEPDAWNPLSLVPGLEEALLWLSEQIDEPPPLTTSDYCSRNPKGSRERRFTVGRRSKEVLFIDSVRRSISWQMRTLYWLARAQKISAVDGLRNVVTIMAAVIRGIPPKVFSDLIRPYFDPQLIGGRKWPTASAAQSAMLELDLASWMVGSGRTASWIHLRSNLPFQAAAMRQLVVQLRARGSLVGNAKAEIEQAPVILEHDVAQRSLRSLAVLLTLFAKFRGPHSVTVRRNYEYRNAQGHNTTGSGGEDTRVVLQLRQATYEQLHAVQRWLVV